MFSVSHKSRPSVDGSLGRVPIGAQAVALLVFVVALWAQVPAVLPGIYGRDAFHLLIGKAMAQGDGLRLINMLDGPSVTIAPVYPFLLSLVWRVWPAFPENVTLMAIGDAALLAVASLGVAWYLTKRSVPFWFAYGVTLVAFLNLPMIWTATARVPEPVFFAAAIWAVFVADYGKKTWGFAVASGLLGAIAALAVPIGWVALAGVTVGWIKRGAKRSAVLAAMGGGILAVGVWGTLIATLQTGGAVVEVNGLVANPVFGLAGIADVAHSLFPWGGGAVRNVLAVALLVGAAFGAWTMFSETPALVVTAAGAVVLALLFSGGTAAWVMIPGFFVLAAVGIYNGAMRGRIIRSSALVFGGFMAAGFLWQAGTVTLTRTYAESGLVAGEGFQWVLPSIKQELPESAVIATEQPFLVYLHTNRKTVGPNDTELTLHDFLCIQRATHLVENRVGRGFFGAEIFDDGFSQLFAITDGPALYQVECQTQP